MASTTFLILGAHLERHRASIETANTNIVSCKRKELPNAKRRRRTDQQGITSFRNSDTCDSDIALSFYLDAPTIWSGRTEARMLFLRYMISMISAARDRLTQ